MAYAIVCDSAVVPVSQQLSGYSVLAFQVRSGRPAPGIIPIRKIITSILMVALISVFTSQ